MRDWRVDGLLGATLVVALWLGAASQANAVPKISLEVTPITFIQSDGPTVTVLRALLHLEDRYALGPAVFNLTLDPGVLLDPSGPGAWTSGLTEAYLQMRRGPVDFRLGIERLPLETARLMIPFSVEDVDIIGTRLGRSGVRLIWNPDASTRVRGALLEDGGTLRPVLSLRRQFPSFELEAHALALAGGRAAVGLSGSGLVGRLVVYGEVWELTTPAEIRSAVGVSGSISNGIWTLEAGNAAAAAVARLIPDPGVMPQVAGQIAYRVSDELSLTGTARVLMDPDALRSQLTVQATRTAGNADYSVSVTALFGGGPSQGIVTATISYSF